MAVNNSKVSHGFYAKINILLHKNKKMSDIIHINVDLDIAYRFYISICLIFI